MKRTGLTTETSLNEKVGSSMMAFTENCHVSLR
jgi:hypothetical protein